MDSDDKDWWFAQSGEYVLGLLGKEERIVFERILQLEPDVQAMVTEWREKLQPLADALPPIAPAEQLVNDVLKDLPEQSPSRAVPRSGASIQDRVSTTTTHVETFDTSSVDELALKRATKSASRWRAATAFAAAACLILAVTGAYLFNKPASVESTLFDSIAIVQNDANQALWVVDVSNESAQIRVTAVAPPELAAESSFELWMVKPDDAGVQSMGLLPVTLGESVLIDVDALDERAPAFAVSLEPLGGSPESVPTGPVLYQGAVQALTL